MAKASKRTKPRKARASRVSKVSQKVRVGGGSDGKPQIIVVQAPGGGGGGGASSSSTAGGGRDTGTNILGPPTFQSPQAPQRPGPFTPIWGNGGYPDSQFTGGYASGQRSGYAGGSFWTPTPDGPQPGRVPSQVGSPLSQTYVDSAATQVSHPEVDIAGDDALDPEGGTTGGGVPVGRGVDADAAAQVDTHQGPLVPTSTPFELAVRQVLDSLSTQMATLPSHFQGIEDRFHQLENSSALVTTQNSRDQQHILSLLHRLNGRIEIAERSGDMGQQQRDEMMRIMQQLHGRLESTREEASNAIVATRQEGAQALGTLQGRIADLQNVADDHAERVDALSSTATALGLVPYNDGISGAGGSGQPAALMDQSYPGQLTIHGTTGGDVGSAERGSAEMVRHGGPETGALINPLTPGTQLVGARAGPLHDALTYQGTGAIVPAGPRDIVTTDPFGAPGPGQQNAMAIEGQQAEPNAFAITPMGFTIPRHLVPPGTVYGPVQNPMHRALTDGSETPQGQFTNWI